VLDWYQKNGTRVVSIDAVGSTDEVARRALAALGR
jgi:hypothetical protein